MTSTPGTAPEELPPGPPAPALVAGLALVTRYRLRLTDARDSRLGELGAFSWVLGAASWTGRRAAFVGFYEAPALGAPADCEARLRAAERWAGERLVIQGAESAAVLLVALGRVDGRLAPAATERVRVGAAAVDPVTAAVEVLAPLPPGLPAARELSAWARAAQDPSSVPTLAAVDLAERQMVAGGYASPARQALTVTQPVVTYALIATWALVYLLEVTTKRSVLTADGFALPYYPVTNAFQLVAGQGLHTDWWRLASVGFVHQPNGVTHVLANSFAMYFIGSSVERLYGPLVLLGTFLGSVVGSSIFYVAAADAGVTTGSVVGASGGIAGLVGLLLVLGRVQGKDVPVGLVSSLRQYAMLVIVMNVVLGFVLTNVSNTGHLGGLLSGAAIGLVLPPLRGVGGRDLRTAERVAIGVVTAFVAVALVVAAVHLGDLLSKPVPAL